MKVIYKPTLNITGKCFIPCTQLARLRGKKSHLCYICADNPLWMQEEKKSPMNNRILLVAGDLTFLSADSIWANYEIPWCTLPSMCIEAFFRPVSAISIFIDKVQPVLYRGDPSITLVSQISVYKTIHFSIYLDNISSCPSSFGWYEYFELGMYIELHQKSKQPVSRCILCCYM